MGAAKEYLGQRECLRILGELVPLTGKSHGPDCVSARCPWHEERTPGAFWYYADRDYARCYSCGRGGDLLDVFCAVEGMEERSAEAFKAFFERFAPDVLHGGAPRVRKTPVPRRNEWRPREIMPLAADWRAGAMSWVKKCAERLNESDCVRLLAWGITPETARACRIGVQPEDRFVPFTHWGLPYAENAKGNERCIHLPAGLVFPVFSLDGELLRVKVRLDHPKDTDPKYKAIVGGVPTCYGIWGDRDVRVWFVVETERDAMLLRQELAPYGIGAMATGSASHAPDDVAHSILSAADCVVNALDNDAAGIAASWGFDPDAPRFSWNLAYPHCLRWPVPLMLGKDPADLVGKLPIADWALSALPPYILRDCERKKYLVDQTAGPTDEAVF